MARKQDSSYALVKKMRDGWYYRLGSGPLYPWLGPFETQHVAERVRESATGGDAMRCGAARLAHGPSKLVEG